MSVNTDVMRQIGELDAANAWAVGRFDAIANSTHVPDEIRSHLPAIQAFSSRRKRVTRNPRRTCAT